MTEHQSCVGLNLTASKLQFVEIEKDSDNLLVNDFGQAFISPPIIFDNQNELQILEQIQASFDELRIRKQIKSNTVSFTLPPELFITIQLPYDSNFNQTEIREEFNWEISQLYPFLQVEELAIKFYELDSSFLPGNNNALVVALNKKYLFLIKKFCLNNSLTPKLVDNSSITANNFINSFFIDRNQVTIHIFNSRSSITLFINISTKPAFVKVFPKEVDNYINKISEEISNKNLMGVNNNSHIVAIISGDDLDTELVAEIGRGTELVFEKFNPFHALKLKPEFQNNEINLDNFSSFVSSAGIASRFNY